MEDHIFTVLGQMGIVVGPPRDGYRVEDEASTWDFHMDSILNTVKKSLGIDADYAAFDTDILMFTNAVLANLNQIGVGPDNGFQIEDADATWDELLGSDPRLNNVKAWVYLKVRLLFDPPATSFGIAAMENMAKELEYRIYTTAEVEKWQDTKTTA